MQQAVLGIILTSSLLNGAVPAVQQGPTCPAQTSGKAAAQLRITLLDMGKADQEVRVIFTQKKLDEFTPEEINHLQEVDRNNLARLKEIVRQCGWPTKRLVGGDGVQSAFIVLQHGDHAFQKQMMPAIETAFKHNQLSNQDYAEFVDRVLVGDGKPQKYGSQVRFSGGQITIEPIEDEAHVDQRRAKLGLMPLKDYMQVLRALYKQ